MKKKLHDFQIWFSLCIYLDYIIHIQNIIAAWKSWKCGAKGKQKKMMKFMVVLKFALLLLGSVACCMFQVQLYYDTWGQ